MKRLVLLASTVALAGGLTIGLTAGSTPASGHPIQRVDDPSQIEVPVAQPVTPPPVVEAAAVTPATVVVVSGDTVSGLASRYGRTCEQFAGLNGLADPNLITVGESLKVPDPGYRPSAGASCSPPVPVASQRASRASLTAPNPVSAIPVRPAVSGASTGGWSQPWACIAEGVAGGARYGTGESGGNPYLDTGNGYWGGLQFAPSTWWANARPLGITVPAYEASIAEQEQVADRVLAEAGWGQWPNTARACGYL